MINRELQSVSVISFTTGTDAYGQRRQSGSTVKQIDMVVKPYSNTIVSDIRFNDVELIGLTTDQSISDKNQILIGSDTYNVLYVIPSHRCYQVLMKKVQG